MPLLHLKKGTKILYLQDFTLERRYLQPSENHSQGYLKTERINPDILQVLLSAK